MWKILHYNEMKGVWRLVVFFAFYLCLGTWNVRGQSQESIQKVEAVKVGFITQRLNLNANQATAFWPIYNAYSNEKKEIKAQVKKLREQSQSISNTDEQILSSLKDMLALKKKEAEIDMLYYEKFKKVITPRQLAELYKAEQDFAKLLLSKLETPDK